MPTPPPARRRALMLLGGAGLGVAMGAVLGAVQAWVLRGSVARPWRWVGVSVAAWTPAMVVILAGASGVPASWPVGAVAVTGTATGAVAGALLGAVFATLEHLVHGPARARDGGRRDDARFDEA